MIKSLSLSIIELSSALWMLDPMNTCCNLFIRMSDEYDNEAKMILEELEAGKSLKQAITDTFDYWFWEGCLDRPSCFYNAEQIALAIEDYLRYISTARTELNNSCSEVELDNLREVNSRLSPLHQIGMNLYRKYYIDDREIGFIEID